MAMTDKKRFHELEARNQGMAERLGVGDLERGAQQSPGQYRSGRYYGCCCRERMYGWRKVR